ncbi:MAG TPA: TadE/TadG family type IV pilus assembly protein [Candidatus Dormibacteraeota bacterium]|nr:TadE/TadG family type IV pilus assembly protein [Candidatus Dormibacteraeota bacterium]
MRGTALMEFALAWPIALLLVLACVELSVWEVESYAARSAALAAARAAAAAPFDPRLAETVALHALAPSLAGAPAAAWCPGRGLTPHGVWVCASDRGNAVEVSIGGQVPALVPLFGGSGLPLHADALVDKERFVR